MSFDKMFDLTAGVYFYLYNIYKDIFLWSFIFGGIRSGVFPVSAPVCGLRNWKSRSNSFVRAPSLGGGSNALRPVLSLPHLAGIGYVGWARQAKSAQIFVFWAVCARASLGSSHIYAELSSSWGDLTYNYVVTDCETRVNQTIVINQ